MPVCATRRELDTRRQHIVRLLRPIRHQNVGCDIGPGHQGALVLCAHDGGRRAQGMAYRGERFRTRVKTIWAQYFEIWREHSVHDGLVLDQLCLNLYQIDSEARVFDELVSVHSEPGADSDMKKGPHLHVKKSVEPLGHCHFPLNYGHLKAVLQSGETLTNALKDAVKILNEELMNRFA